MSSFTFALVLYLLSFTLLEARTCHELGCLTGKDDDTIIPHPASPIECAQYSCTAKKITPLLEYHCPFGQGKIGLINSSYYLNSLRDKLINDLLGQHTCTIVSCMGSFFNEICSLRNTSNQHRLDSKQKYYVPLTRVPISIINIPLKSYPAALKRLDSTLKVLKGRVEAHLELDDMSYYSLPGFQLSAQKLICKTHWGWTKESAKTHVSTEATICLGAINDAVKKYGILSPKVETAKQLDYFCSYGFNDYRTRTQSTCIVQRGELWISPHGKAYGSLGYVADIKKSPYKRSDFQFVYFNQTLFDKIKATPPRVIKVSAIAVPDRKPYLEWNTGAITDLDEFHIRNDSHVAANITDYSRIIMSPETLNKIKRALVIP